MFFSTLRWNVKRQPAKAKEVEKTSSLIAGLKFFFRFWEFIGARKTEIQFSAKISVHNLSLRSPAILRNFAYAVCFEATKFENLQMKNFDEKLKGKRLKVSHSLMAMAGEDRRQFQSFSGEGERVLQHFCVCYYESIKKVLTKFLLQIYWLRDEFLEIKLDQRNIKIGRFSLNKT